MKVCPHCARRFAGDGWHCPACGWQVATIDDLPALAPELAREGGGFEDSFFSELADLEQSSFWFHARARLIVWALRRFYPAAETLLEVGCGNGAVLASIAQANPRLRLTGSELFSAGLRFAAHRIPQARLIQMDARRIPFDSEFDVVGAFDVLEHIEEDELVLGQMRQALRPGGGLLLAVPQHQFLWSEADVTACHVRRYSARALHARVTAAGFRIQCSTSFVSLLLPLMVLSRLRKRKPQGDACARITTELNLQPWLNRTLGAVMTAERRAIELGMRFPLGGSRLLVAQAS